MEEIIPKFDFQLQPTYTSILHEKKMRRMRHFGAFRLFTADGKVKVLWPEEYMFIKNEPKTEYTHSHEDLFVIHKKENQTKIEEEHEKRNFSKNFRDR